MINNTVFAEYANYYDLLYKEKNYTEEVIYCDRLIKQFNPGAEKILELGSGTGKHACLLAAQGYKIHGIERSMQMLAQAQKNSAGRKYPSSQSPVFSLGDIRTARIPEKFHAALSLFHVMSYQATNDDLDAAFQTARVHLDTGGIFIFDAWYGPAVLTDLPAVRIKRMADERIEVTRLAEPKLFPNENRVDVRYHIFLRNLDDGHVKETKEIHSMRYFFYPEITIHADKAGFNVEHVEEWLTGAEVGFGTWGSCFILRAV